MSEFQKELDPETIARMGREWDRGINEKRALVFMQKLFLHLTVEKM
jgi:hypothetical protein